MQKSLGELLIQMRLLLKEAVHPATAAPTQQQYINLLNMTQRQLVDTFEWPFLKIKKRIQLEKLTKKYFFPPDIDSDKHFEMRVKLHGTYYPLVAGEIDLDELNASDPAKCQTAVRPLLWEFDADCGCTPHERMFAVWPLPAEPLCLYIKGTKRVPEMTDLQSLCILDADLLALRSAAMVTNDQSLKQWLFAQAAQRERTLRKTTPNLQYMQDKAWHQYNCEATQEIRVHPTKPMLRRSAY